MPSPIRHSLLLNVALLAATILVAGVASEGGTCPAVKKCAVEGVEALVNVWSSPSFDVAYVQDITECQLHCRTTDHAYYQFSPDAGVGVCHCLDGCESLMIGKSTVGLVSACEAESTSDSKNVEMQKQQQHQKSLGMKQAGAAEGGASWWKDLDSSVLQTQQWSADLHSTKDKLGRAFRQFIQLPVQKNGV